MLCFILSILINFTLQIQTDKFSIIKDSTIPVEPLSTHQGRSRSECAVICDQNKDCVAVTVTTMPGAHHVICGLYDVTRMVARSAVPGIVTLQKCKSD